MDSLWKRLSDEATQVSKDLRIPSADRRDLVQETLLRVWPRVRHEKLERRTRGLIATVVKNLQVDRWRAQSRDVPLGDLELASHQTPLDEVEFQELRQRLFEGLKALPAEQREVIRMRLFEKWSFRKIAAKQGVPLGTALGRMHLALGTLRKNFLDQESP